MQSVMHRWIFEIFSQLNKPCLIKYRSRSKQDSINSFQIHCTVPAPGLPYNVVFSPVVFSPVRVRRTVNRASASLQKRCLGLNTLSKEEVATRTRRRADRPLMPTLKPALSSSEYSTRIMKVTRAVVVWRGSSNNTSNNLTTPVTAAVCAHH